MRISGYTMAANVRGKLLPYKACIESMCLLADEVWVAYDALFDDPNDFTEIDPKVKVIKYPLMLEHVDGYGRQLSVARNQCNGDWLMWFDLDEIIHEKDVGTIFQLLEYAENNKYTCIELGLYQYLVKGYTFGLFQQDCWGIRPKFLKNLEGVHHGAPDDAIKMDEQGHAYLLSGDGVDFVKDGKGYGHRSLIYKDFPFLNKIQTGVAKIEDIIQTTQDFPYIYHYSRYSMQRKLKMNMHQRESYIQGHSLGYNLEEWQNSLATNVELMAESEMPGAEWLGPVAIPHPACILDWVNMIDEKIGRL